MLEKFAQKRILITIIYGTILLVLFSLYIIFGNTDNKPTMIIATIVGLPFFYFGIRLMFKIVRTKASPKIIQFGSWFFLIAGTLGIVISLFEFIRSFPNGFSPMLSCVMGMWLAILTDVDKHKD